MTGFGRASGMFGDKKILIELKALNSKGLDLNVKMHPNYKEIEPQLRHVITKELERGKIDLQIHVEYSGTTKNVVINANIVLSYAKELKSINQQLDIHNDDYDYLSLAMQMPDIYINENEQLSSEEQQFVMDLMHQACGQLTQFRKQEGLSIEQDLRERILAITHLLDQITHYEPRRLETIRERITSKLNELTTIKYDDNRLEQELIYYIERLDISEEKVRLTNHLHYFLETLNIANSGKKLGFIAQEIGREINTLGSKSNQSDMQKLVVDMKDNLEKIKEQLLNIL